MAAAAVMVVVVVDRVVALAVWAVVPPWRSTVVSLH